LTVREHVGDSTISVVPVPAVVVAYQESLMLGGATPVVKASKFS
jgi:hypothetical protein